MVQSGTVRGALVVWLALLSGAAEAQSAGAAAVARRASFDTDEGTWMSVNVSPDGKTLLFDLLGEIYSLDIAGGNARPLVTGPAFDMQPVFSPNGREFVFISDGSGTENLWIAAADGSNPRQITHQTEHVFASPAWSPDGEYVYVTEFDSRIKLVANTSIWMYHRLGGRGAPLDSSAKPGTYTMGASPSSDGRFLYFAGRGAGRGEYGQAGPHTIYKRDLRTGSTFPLIHSATTPDSDAGAIQPVISPDGRLLAYGVMFEGSGELRLRDLESGADDRLAYPIEYPMINWSSAFQGLLPGYAFTPDSREILIGYGGKIRRVNVQTSESRVVPFNAKVDLALGPDLRLAQKDETGPVRARVIQAPSLSPDGRTLVFAAFGKLYVVPVAGGKPSRLTNTPMAMDQPTENQPSWSPDGGWIVYASWSPDGGYLWKVRSDGKDAPVRLTQSAGYYRKPVYTPDGKTIVALRSSMYDRMNFIQGFGEAPFPQDVVRLSADGGRVDLVTQLAASGNGWDDLPKLPDLGKPHFTRDGASVFVHTRRGLLQFPLSGGEARVAAKVVTDNFMLSGKIAVADALLSPDGKWALAQSNFQLHVVAIPPTGGEGAAVDIDDPATRQRQITDIGADYFDWADEGRSIVWSIGSTFYKIPFDSVMPGRTQRPAGVAEDHLRGVQIAVELPRDVPETRLVLRGATAVTMRGDEIIENADIVVEHNRIAAVGPGGSVTIPRGAKILDVSGKVITPGFVDTHAHYSKALLRQQIDYRGWEMPAALAYGVTTSFDPQSMDDTFVYGDLIDAGMLIGPRDYTTGPSLSPSMRIASKEQAKAILRRYRDHYRTLNIKSYMVGSRQQRQYVVQAAQEIGVMPTTENWGMPRYALTQAIDGFAANEHASDGVDYYRDVALLYAQAGTGYSATTLTGGASGLMSKDYFASRYSPLKDAKLNRFTPRIYLAEWRRMTWAPDEDFNFARLTASAAKIFRAGGNVGLGSHGELQGLGYHWEMQAYAMGGLTPHEVLQIATRSSARVIGHLPDVGTIEAGKYADLLVFGRSPLADIRNTAALEYVIKNGRQYEAATLREIWPRPREYRPK